MAGVPASALASPRGRGSDRYYFIVGVDRTGGDSLGLVLSARPDGFLVEEIASCDGTDTATLIAVWNRACAATYPDSVVRSGDLLVRVNRARVSAVPGADCCRDLHKQLATCQPLLLVVSRPLSSAMSAAATRAAPASRVGGYICAPRRLATRRYRCSSGWSSSSSDGGQIHTCCRASMGDSSRHGST